MQQDNVHSQTLPTHSAEGGRAPKVWLLLDDRPGHATQVKGLAQHMDWHADPLSLKFNPLNRMPNPLLGCSLFSLRRCDVQKLRPPYPDIVVGMGRRIVPIARWIKKNSGGTTRIVLLGRKAAGNASHIDFMVSCVHFNQVPREGFFELVVPPTQVNAESLAAARKARPSPLAGLQQPRVVLLLGGPTAQHSFDETDAAQMVSQVAMAAAQLGGDLAVVTSRRTPSATVDAIHRLAPNTLVHVWKKDEKDNPYLSFLAHADLLVVTGESESMISEAAATGLPLTIYPLREKPQGLKNRVTGALRSRAGLQGMLAALCRYIFLAGWLVPPRDLRRMHLAMENTGMASLFNGALNTSVPKPSGEFETLAQRLAELTSGER